MTIEEFQILKNTNLDQYINDNTIELAFKGVSPIVCREIKYLQKARKKMPVYYDARAIIPSLSFEQSSSGFTSSVKNYHGRLCVDMTCGLGVDSLHLSHHFDKVISIERDEVLCEVARYNFKKIGVSNIEVVNAASLDYLSKYEGADIDLIYVDPARRSEDKKVYLFEDCSPNIFDLLKIAPKLTGRVVIKSSPLFDVKEAERLFAAYGEVIAETISVDNECKELVIDIKFSEHKLFTLKNTVIDKYGVVKYYTFDPSELRSTLVSIKEEIGSEYNYLHVADISFYKSRTLESYLCKYLKDSSLCISGVNGVVFSESELRDIAGKSYKIKHILSLKPKQIKSYLKANKIKSLSILKRGGKHNTTELRKMLGLKDGSDATIIEVNDFIVFLE